MKDTRSLIGEPITKQLGDWGHATVTPLGASSVVTLSFTRTPPRGEFDRIVGELYRDLQGQQGNSQQ